MQLSIRLLASIKAAAAHFVVSAVVVLLAALLVFGLWFPGAYKDIASGTELFLLIMAVDIVCGPLLTLVLFDAKKSYSELFIDLSIVGILQLAALVYGLWTVWQVRPLYLPHEFDRFKVVALYDLRGANTNQLPTWLQPSFFKGPIPVSIREPKNPEEKNKVLFEALNGGADYGDRPDFYLPFDNTAAKKTLIRARFVKDFLARHPHQKPKLEEIAKQLQQPIEQLKYLPIKARKDWIAVLTPTGHIAGFVPGDGF
jgi:hypothetical protein